MKQPINLLIFPLLTLLAGIMILAHNQAIVLNPDGATRVYIKSALSGNVGYGNPLRHNNSISFEGLEPGDIILGAYPHCAYGDYSHAALYIGSGQIIEGYADLGITRQSVEHFREYPQVCLLRVNVDPAVKQAAVAYATEQIGEVFYPVAFKSGQNIWNCSKIMWKAYQLQGVDFDDNQDLWVPPDSFYNSPYVEVIREVGLLW
ncbi:MAG TPA: hypothetical protein DER60_00780 [Syntrophomonas sp.]|jgi:cell wall-associated NlpC family hydrolase|nr:hypothetical protein [Syntrophomonas sp.]